MTSYDLVTWSSSVRRAHIQNGRHGAGTNSWRCPGWRAGRQKRVNITSSYNAPRGRFKSGVLSFVSETAFGLLGTKSSTNSHTHAGRTLNYQARCNFISIQVLGWDKVPLLALNISAFTLTNDFISHLEIAPLSTDNCSSQAFQQELQCPQKYLQCWRNCLHRLSEQRCIKAAVKSRLVHWQWLMRRYIGRVTVRKWRCIEGSPQ